MTLSSRSSGELRISGFGLQLREWRDDDIPHMVALFDDPAVARWTPLASPFDTVAARDYLAMLRERELSEQRIQLAITVNGVTPVGEILLFKDRLFDNGTELAYAIGPQSRGQGLAARAVRLMTEYARETLSANRIVLRIDPGNEASAAVARKAGFHLTDEAPIILPREPSDVLDERTELHTWLFSPERCRSGVQDGVDVAEQGR